MTKKFSDIEVVEETIEDEPTSQREHAEFVMRRFDPFGFIHIKHKNKPGPLPEELNGTFTTFDAAGRAIDSYVNKLVMKNKSKVA